MFTKSDIQMSFSQNMAGPTFSPDGKWMWTGSEWIPAPPDNSHSMNRSLPQIGHQSFVQPNNQNQIQQDWNNSNQEPASVNPKRIGVVISVISIVIIILIAVILSGKNLPSVDYETTGYGSIDVRLISDDDPRLTFDSITIIYFDSGKGTECAYDAYSYDGWDSECHYEIDECSPGEIIGGVVCDDEWNLGEVVSVYYPYCNGCKIKLEVRYDGKLLDGSNKEVED